MNAKLTAYRAFLAAKASIAPVLGFDCQLGEVNPILKPFQRVIVAWAVRGGRRAIFTAFGLGTSVENQEQADKRIPELLRCPAKVRFLSCEPFIGSASLSQYLGTEIQVLGPSGSIHYRRPPGYREDDVLLQAQRTEGYRLQPVGPSPIHWVICGGESGPNARPMHPDWVRSLRDQCLAAGVPFFFKQWGAWVTEDQSPEDAVLPSIRKLAWAHLDDCGDAVGDETCVYKVGKHKAGRLLDGRTWDEFPEVKG